MAVNLQGIGLTLEQAIAMVQSEDISDQYYAAWYLGHLADAKAVDALLLALQDTHNRTTLGGYPLRRKAAEALGRIGDLRAVDPLLETMTCEDIFLREQAAWALGELGDRRAIAPLAALLDPQALEAHEAIIEALGKLARKFGETFPECQPALLRYLVEHPQERIRCAAARTLFVLTADAQYGEFLMARLTHPDVHIRRAAIFDLAEIAYLPAAEAIVRCEVTQNMKVHALKQMVDLSQDKSPTQLEGVLTTLATLF